MQPPYLARVLVRRLPFFYGWVVLGCVCLAGFARQGPAVAVFSVFVVPMTETFGWSRTEMAGAVSVGGLLAALVTPALGPLLDRHGARLMLCVAVLGTGLATRAVVPRRLSDRLGQPRRHPPRQVLGQSGVDVRALRPRLQQVRRDEARQCAGSVRRQRRAVHQGGVPLGVFHRPPHQGIQRRLADLRRLVGE